ncbi:MAG: hypothetical protein KBG25_00650 [Paludibacteraceae bacterium]|nr:hypothetical protein [Paludibacteraceae bacterium]
MINLDYICAKTGQDIGENAEDKKENILRKALGILQEDGVYAMFLWLEKEDKSIRKSLIDLLKDDEIKSYLNVDFHNNYEDFNAFCKQLQEVAKDIDKLFFLKKILERTLTFALYHSKLKEKKNVDKA